MGSMHNAGSAKPEGTRPEPKSKNRKSVGPSMLESSGTEKTDAGSKKGLEKRKAGVSESTRSGANTRRGTVRRPSKASRVQNAANAKTAAKWVTPSSRRKKSATKTTQLKPSIKKPVSKSRGKNISSSSSRHTGQR